MFRELRKIKNCLIRNFQLYTKKQDFLTSASETGENVYLLVFLSFVSCGLYAKYFFDVMRNHSSNRVFVFPDPGPMLGPRPPALAPNLYLPALAPNLYLPALAPNLYLSALAPNLYLPALTPNLCLPQICIYPLNPA